MKLTVTTTAYMQRPTLNIKETSTGTNYFHLQEDTTTILLLTLKMSETKPLLGSGNNGNSAFYFQNTDKSELSKYESVTDNDGGQVVENPPPGTGHQDFEPRAIGAVQKVCCVGGKTL